MESGICHLIENAAIYRFVGADRQKWLHNFCTAEIKDLQPGQGCEAFVLNVKGKTIAHVIILASKYDLTMLMLGEPDISLLDHFNKYIITEDVTVEDIGENFRLWYVSGQKLDSMFSKSVTSQELYAHGLVRDRSIAVRTNISRKNDWFTLVTKTESISKWYGGVKELDAEAFEALRIRGGWPITGKEVTLDRLPQEFCRDEQAISFDKGCYLGQETVARIDALGHVNYLMARLEWQAELVPGIELTRDEKVVGKVTSALGNNGLGFVRRLMAKTGEGFQSASGDVTIV